MVVWRGPVSAEEEVEAKQGVSMEKIQVVVSMR